MTGSVRDTFSRFSALETIDLSNNRLTGAIPTRLFNLPNIKTIRLDTNTFDGTIPQNLGNAPKLELLLLQQNALSGSIPAIGSSSLQTLQQLKLFDNQLTGSLPESVCQLVSQATLRELSSDCGGIVPKIDCPCCTECFDNS